MTLDREQINRATIVKGKKIRFNGSPLQMDKMDRLSKEHVYYGPADKYKGR